MGSETYVDSTLRAKMFDVARDVASMMEKALGGAFTMATGEDAPIGVSPHELLAAIEGGIQRRIDDFARDQVLKERARIVEVIERGIGQGSVKDGLLVHVHKGDGSLHRRATPGTPDFSA